MNAEKWWTNVSLERRDPGECASCIVWYAKSESTQIIRNTFQPLIGSQQELPPDLVPKLIYQFWSNEGYMLQPYTKDAIRVLRGRPRTLYDRVVIGVITNSDDRVPDVLSSLGLRMSPLRYGARPAQNQTYEQEWDVDFTVMSYDVGYEKPDVRIFQAAEDTLDVVLQSCGEPSWTAQPNTWDKIYVGDEYDKDVVGARNAGWGAILVGEDVPSTQTAVTWSHNEPAMDLLSSLKSNDKVVYFSGLDKLAEWLARLLA